MPKSQIIIDIVEEIVPLDQSMSRLMVLARDVKNKRLETWAKNELNGYSDDEDIPSYRKTRSTSLIYSGINGGFHVSNTPMPIYWILEEHRDICDISIADGLKYIIELAYSEAMPKRDLTILANDVYKNSEGMVTCTSISQIIPQSVYLSILSIVKNIMIAALCELEDKYGNLDNLGIDISKRNSFQVESNNIDMNRAIFNISVPNVYKEKRTPWYSKIGWNVIVPTITAIIGAVIATIIIKLFGL